jgi:drug/metabolite transporter (DMT)-like permease
MSPRLAGLLFALGAALTWSSAGVGVKLLPLGALPIAGFRSLFALPLLAGALLWRNRQRPPSDETPPSPASLPALVRYALSQPLVLAGAVAYALCVTLFVLATKLTTAANAILFQYSAPVWVALLSWPLLGERVRGVDWLAIVGCLLGMGWCFADKLSGSGWLGNGLALVSGLGFGLLPLIWRRQQEQPTAANQPDLRPQLPQLTLVLGNLLTCAVALPWMVRDLPSTATIWLAVALLGLVQIGVAYLLYAEAVRRLRAIECLLAAMLEPILNPLWVALFAHEQPGRATLFGGAVILGAVLLHGLLTSRQR